MRAVIQRVSEASVWVEGSAVATIGTGLAVLVGVGRDDGPADSRALAAKLIDLRIFPDAGDKMNRSVREVDGAVLVVSQFTLQAEVSRGRRPSFTAAAPGAAAEPLVEELAAELRRQGVEVASGVFGARMEVTLTNQGPVTLVLETRAGKVI
jgi:D-tyrosyl-tRNA(Tyr) deacylase